MRVKVRIRAAGILYRCKSTGTLLLGKRSARSAEPGQWANFGGKIEVGESPKEAAIREVEEETGYIEDQPDQLKLFYISNNGKVRFFCYLRDVDEEFELPHLELEEHSESGWFPADDLPTPLLATFAKYVKAESIAKMESTIHLLSRINETRYAGPINFLNELTRNNPDLKVIEVVGQSDGATALVRSTKEGGQAYEIQCRPAMYAQHPSIRQKGAGKGSPHHGVAPINLKRSARIAPLP